MATRHSPASKRGATLSSSLETVRQKAGNRTARQQLELVCRAIDHFGLRSALEAYLDRQPKPDGMNDADRAWKTYLSSTEDA